MSATRRDFLTTSALAALASMTVTPATLRAWSLLQNQAQPAFTPIRRNVGTFAMRGGTIGYLIDPAAVVVVDSQFPAEATACLNGLNERSGGRAIAALVNTHHHADHSDGNISFKGAARTVVAHARASELMRNPPGMALSAGEHLFPDTTFAELWTLDAGGERVRAKFYGPAHTSGDVVVTFERANVAHMGDLAFNQRHPIVDRAAGASIRNWIAVLGRAAADHDNDTIYVFGHANTGLPITGSRTDLERFREYLGALLAYVEAQVTAGRTREEILANRDPLPGFESFGRFGATGAREAKTVAYEEVTTR